MKGKTLRKSILALLLLIFVIMFTACRQGDDTPGVFNPGDLPEWMTESDALEIGWTGIDRNVVAELNVMMWGPGGRIRMYDVGRVDYDPQTIQGRYAAAVTAASRVFNVYFPYVQINYFSPGWQSNWIQQRQDFYMEFGAQPDVFMTDNIPEEIIRGNIADLTLFAHDPVFELFNPTVMRMMTHHERIWGVPMFMIPWGLFVNRTLAENQNLDMPTEDWTLREFEDFVTNSRRDEFYGIGDTPWHMFNTLTRDFHYQLLWREPGEPFVRMDTQGMRDINRIIPRISQHAFLSSNNRGEVSSAFIDGRSQWALFAQGALLTFQGDPWNLRFAGSPTYTGRVQVPDWDIFPRPSTDWVGNHVGTVTDPMAIRNYAMDDGDPLLSREEYDNMRLAWEFVRFYTADIRSWRARSEMLYGPSEHSALDESFPTVIGSLYYDMMDLFFQAPEREIFASAARFPGFTYITQLWEQGQFWGFWNDNVFPQQGRWEGGMRAISHEWNTRWNAAIVGSGVDEPAWVDQLMGHLPLWDDAFNHRWQERFDDITEAMFRFYPFVPSRFS